MRVGQSDRPRQRRIPEPGSSSNTLFAGVGATARVRSSAGYVGAIVKLMNRKPRAKRKEPPTVESPSALIDARIAELGDWRGEMLARIRALIHEAIPGVSEEWKWRGTPVWSQQGIVCTGETYKQVVKLTFAHGASLNDPASLFNSSLEGNVRRAIDLREGDRIDARKFKALVRAAAKWNAERKAAKS